MRRRLVAAEDPGNVLSGGIAWPCQVAPPSVEHVTGGDWPSWVDVAAARVYMQRWNWPWSERATRPFDGIPKGRPRAIRELGTPTGAATRCQGAPPSGDFQSDGDPAAGLLC